jgi:hypothetical protein
MGTELGLMRTPDRRQPRQLLKRVVSFDNKERPPKPREAVRSSHAPEIYPPAGRKIARPIPCLDSGVLVEPTDFPATERSAELEARRLGCGALEALIQEVAELIACGKFDGADPWPGALLLRRVRDLGDADVVVTDEVVRPLLDLPCAAEVVRTATAAAAKDPSGRLGLLADALATIHTEDEFAVLVRGGWMSKTDAAEARRRIAFEFAVGRHDRPIESRRRSRWRRSLLAELDHLEDGARPWPVGRGRRPGSKGARTQARCADMSARFQALTAEEQANIIGQRRLPARSLVRQHAARHGISLATAERDWLAVRRQLHERGLLGVAHLGAKREPFERRLTA